MTASAMARAEPAGRIGTADAMASRQRFALREGEAAPAASWRDEARRVLVVVGAMIMIFLPAAAFVVGRLSPAFAAFAFISTATWLVATAAQIAALRLVRSGAGFDTRSSWTLQFLAVAVVGVVVKLSFNSLVNPYSSQLGLDSQEGWESVISAWTSVLVAVYLVWEREARSRQALAARRLFGVQQAQLRPRRNLVDAQLRAMQARVDPRFFFATLDAIETFYRREPARAEALFDELIAFLRTALPHLDDTSSTLARELDLAGSTLRMHGLVSGFDHTLQIRVGGRLEGLPFPAGVLLPLLRGALDASAAPIDSDGVIATGRMSIEADLEPATVGDVLHIQIGVTGAPPSAVVDGVRESLHRLFGDAAQLSCRIGDTGFASLDIRIPHEP